MEVYKKLDSQNEKFKKLLIDTFSKSKIEEGKILTGTITKVTEKHVYILIEGLKSEAMIDIGEIKTTYPGKEIKENEKLDVYLEKIEDARSGEVIVSCSKAQKIKGFWALEKACETNETIKGEFVSKIKGGLIGSHKDSGALFFVPGSQVENKMTKSFDHLFGKELEFKVIKVDKIRGNCLCSRKEVLSSQTKEKKEDIIAKYKVGDIIKNATIKGFSSFGVFAEVDDSLDVLIHQSEISYSRISSPEELFSIGQKQDLKIISIDKTKMQISCSIKALSPSPFDKDNISKYEVGKIYPGKIISIADYGLFIEIESGLTCLAHASQLFWNKKNVSPGKSFKVGQVIDVMIQEIDLDKQRIAVSHKLTKENPYQSFATKYPQGSKVKGVIQKIKDLSIYIYIKEFDINIFCHATDLSWVGKPEEEIKKLKVEDEIEVKVMELIPDEQKCRTSRRALQDDPFEIVFKEKKVGDIVTVKVKSTSLKGIMVSPENSDNIEILIKKNQIAINVEDQRSQRFVTGDRIDAAIAEIKNRKVSLSIKLLEEMQNKEAIKLHSSPLSGKNLPFSKLSETLSEKLDKKKEEDK